MGFRLEVMEVFLLVAEVEVEVEVEVEQDWTGLPGLKYWEPVATGASNTAVAGEREGGYCGRQRTDWAGLI